MTAIAASKTGLRPFASFYSSVPRLSTDSAARLSPASRCSRDPPALPLFKRWTHDSAPPNHVHKSHQHLDLSYRLFRPKDGPSTFPPLLILHGLLGSKRNWTSLSSKIAGAAQRDVYAIDARNHGHSPHSPEHSLEAVARDLVHFMDALGLKKGVLMGHSSGAKAAMLFALKHPARIQGLVAVDGSPLGREPKGEVKRIARYVDALEQVVERKCKTFEEAEDVLKEFEEVNTSCGAHFSVS